MNASDDHGLTQIVFTASGAATSSQTQPVSGTSASKAFSVTIPVTATAGSTVQITADISDNDGNVARIGPRP